eukprot:COSAG05_NODE_2620_length_2831_cov_3.267577_2_plen_355_part_01
MCIQSHSDCLALLLPRSEAAQESDEGRQSPSGDSYSNRILQQQASMRASQRPLPLAIAEVRAAAVGPGCSWACRLAMSDPLTEAVLAGDAGAPARNSAQRCGKQRQGVSALESCSHPLSTNSSSQAEEGVPPKQSVARDLAASMGGELLAVDGGAPAQGHGNKRTAGKLKRSQRSPRSPNSCGDKEAARLKAHLQKQRGLHAAHLLAETGRQQVLLAEQRQAHRELQITRHQAEAQEQARRKQKPPQQQQQQGTAERLRHERGFAGPLVHSLAAALPHPAIDSEVLQSPSMPHIEAMAFRLQAATAKRRGAPSSVARNEVSGSFRAQDKYETPEKLSGSRLQQRAENEEEEEEEE